MAPSATGPSPPPYDFFVFILFFAIIIIGAISQETSVFVVADTAAPFSPTPSAAASSAASAAASTTLPAGATSFTTTIVVESINSIKVPLFQLFTTCMAGFGRLTQPMAELVCCPLLCLYRSRYQSNVPSGSLLCCLQRSCLCEMILMGLLRAVFLFVIEYLMVGIILLAETVNDGIDSFIVRNPAY